MQRLNVNPDRVMAFAHWEKRVKAELENSSTQVARINTDHPETVSSSRQWTMSKPMAIIELPLSQRTFKF